MPEILQNLLIILLPAYILIDNRAFTIINHWPITVGFFAGLIMGDLPTAMKIAGTFQLMSLGITAVGGSSIPDYALGTVVAIFINSRTSVDVGTAVAIGLPVGILAVNLDVLTHTLNSFIAEKSRNYLLKQEFRKMRLVNFVSYALVMLQAIIPMSILVLFGAEAVQNVIDIVPAWVTNGLNLAGGMLPVVGIVMLMRFMPTKKYIWTVIVGYVLSAYVNLPILAISLMGFAFAIYIFGTFNNINTASQKNEPLLEDGDFDE